MEEKPVEVQKRKECELVPEGVSCTETIIAYYIRIRNGKRRLTLRVPKDNYFESAISIDELASVNIKNWYGVYGTKG